MPSPYDLIAEDFANARSAFREQDYVDRFIALATPREHILDLGCGTGLPIARYLIDRGFRVTGVDNSGAMLARAKSNCPEAEFLLRDMTALALEGPFGGVVAWDSVFHVPRAHHERLFGEVSGLLKPRSPMLLSVGGSEGEFTAPMFETEFSYSGFAPPRTLRLLERCGFEVLAAEVDDPTSRGHVAILCARTG